MVKGKIHMKCICGCIYGYGNAEPSTFKVFLCFLPLLFMAVALSCANEDGTFDETSEVARFLRWLKEKHNAK